MANPRQRRKSRAGNRGKPTGNALRRLHNKLNRAPTLKGPEALQQKWDKKKTVFQK
jgi:nucleolar protein 16